MREERTDLSLELGGVVLVPSSVELSARAHVVVDASSKEELREGEGRKRKGVGQPSEVRFLLLRNVEECIAKLTLSIA